MESNDANGPRPSDPDLSAQAEIPKEQDEKEEEKEIALDEDKELNEQERIQLYDKGVRFKTNRNYQHALLCFLGCIKGLEKTIAFPMLPNCLQNIASIYAKFEDFPKAVQFMQAAKMYYETAIIGTQEVKGDTEYQTMDENATEDDAKRANEYEKLSHDCIKEKNIHLALEYCGKATQLRRKVYGENHSVTAKSLDLFTVIYAEMGKIQYSEAIGKFDKKDTLEKETNKDKQGEDAKESATSKPEEEIEKPEMSEKLLHSEEKETKDPQVDSENKPPSSFLSLKQLILLFLISAFFAVFITWIWCQYSENEACPSYEYLGQTIKFYYYYYVQSWLTDSKYI